MALASRLESNARVRWVGLVSRASVIALVEVRTSAMDMAHAAHKATVLAATGTTEQAATLSVQVGLVSLATTMGCVPTKTASVLAIPTLPWVTGLGPVVQTAWMDGGARIAVNSVHTASDNNAVVTGDARTT